MTVEEALRPGNALVELTASTPADTGSGDLGAPLYVAWQITNECNLACMHCIESSGPGKAFRDELERERVFAVLKQFVDAEVPYISFSGGEPMAHPHFFEMVEFLCRGGVQLKIETNAHLLTDEGAARLAAAGIKAVQVSLDGGSRETYNRVRVRGDFDRMTEGVGYLKKHGVPIEINYSPTKFNVHEIGGAVELAHKMGAYSFYTGRMMYTGNAVKAWDLLGPSKEQYDKFFADLKAKCDEYDGRMRVYYHEMGLVEELRYRLDNPAALFIILPNGLVKLINALPFVCGDLREQTLTEVWHKYQQAWKDPKVARFVADMADNPKLTSELHQWVFL